MPIGEQADPVAELRARLQRHPPDRRPLQHATAQFHLGSALLDEGRLDQAEECFATAAALFAARGALPEQAKALNGLGATLRAAGRLELAGRALEHAAAGLAAAALPLEEGAARFNLGLVRRDSGDLAGAAKALERATELLDRARVPAQAAAALRELGATRLELADLDAAEAALSDALALADAAGDHAGRAAVANALGLARLARGSVPDAADAFRTAVAASPRGVRPESFATAKANLALALERTGAAAQARLAARQALSAPAVPSAVRDQAAAVLARLGDAPSDLRTALDEEGDEQERARLVREELLRSADAPDAELADDMRAWVDAHTASSEPEAIGELWLGGLLELPPEALERLARSTLEVMGGLPPDARDEFRTAITRAMARFHVPQWMRLQDVFSRAAASAGDPGPWR